MHETEFGAHYRCAHCQAVRPKTEIIHCDDTPVCRDNPKCKEAYYARTYPRPRRIYAGDDGHC